MNTMITLLLLLQQAIPKWSIDDLTRYMQNEKKPVIVNLWATFCKPCVAEIPYFQRITDSAAAGKVDILLLSLDLPNDYPDKIRDFATKQGFHAPIAWLNETDANVFGPKIDSTWTGAIPSSIFINPATGYRKFYEGELSPAQFRKALQALLADSHGN
jgi:thiol-disulfide isomerase/thioredoxin